MTSPLDPVPLDPAALEQMPEQIPEQEDTALVAFLQAHAPMVLPVPTDLSQDLEERLFAAIETMPVPVKPTPSSGQVATRRARLLGFGLAVGALLAGGGGWLLQGLWAPQPASQLAHLETFLETSWDEAMDDPTTEDLWLSD
jgi:hypothetical protein